MDRVTDKSVEADNFFQSCCNFLLPLKDSSGNLVSTAHIPCCPQKTCSKKATRVTRSPASPGLPKGQQIVINKENFDPNIVLSDSSQSKSQTTPRNCPPCGVGIIWRVERVEQLNKEVLVVDSQEPGSLDYQTTAVHDGDILVSDYFF
jgi:hypothetical protein